MKKLAYVDHSFHKKTHSTDFLAEALEGRFEVTRLWDERWRGGPEVDVSELAGFDAAVFFQLAPSRQTLMSLRCPAVVVPMFDNPLTDEELGLLALFDVKAIAFAEAQVAPLAKRGIEVWPVKYAPALTPTVDAKGVETTSGDRNLAATEDRPNVFFWERGAIRWEDVRTLIGDQKPGTVYVKLDPDPGSESSAIPEVDLERFNIEVLSGWMEREQYFAILERCDLYIAPRKVEGIGQSYLEAMAMGIAVAAFDGPTMNEYIRHGENGYLFTIPPSGSVDLSRLRQLGAQARKDMELIRCGYHKRLVEIVANIDSLTYARPRSLKIVSHDISGRLRTLQLGVRLRGRRLVAGLKRRLTRRGQ